MVHLKVDTPKREKTDKTGLGMRFLRIKEKNKAGLDLHFPKFVEADNTRLLFLPSTLPFPNS